jgi:hypothetical protein
VPFLLDGLGVSAGGTTAVDARVVYSSIVFEGSQLRSVQLRHGSFVNASFRGVDWQHVSFVDCDLGDITLDVAARFDDVRFVECRLESVCLIDEDEEETREFAPARIHALLQRIGVEVEAAESGPAPERAAPEGDGEFRRLVTRVLRVFRRTTILPATIFGPRFGSHAGRVASEVMPFLEDWSLVEEKAWRGSGTSRAWVLRVPLDQILQSRDDEMNRFWAAVDERG